MLPRRLDPRRQITAVLAAVGLSLIGAELMAALVIPRVSKVEARVTAESRAARDLLASTGPEGRLLVVGNSLLEAGVDPALMAQTLAPAGWRAQRQAIEATNYQDWYLGLRRAFRSVGRPDAVLLLLSPNQFAARGLRGDYTAHHLLSPGDAIRAGQRADLHPTQTSGLVLASLSSYYGLRTEIRQFFLQRLVPGVQSLADLIANRARAERRRRQAEPSDEELGRRLDEFQGLCRAYQVRCLFALSTELEPQSWAPRLAALAQARGLATQDLQSRQGWEAADFTSDRYHMSPVGARKYTPELFERVKTVLGPRGR